MKKSTLSATIILFAVLAFSFATFLETLELTKENAEDAIWDCFAFGTYAGPSSPDYHKFAVPMRVSMIKEIGAFAKAFSRTDQFKARYAEYRKGKQPTPPDPLVTTAELKKQQKEGIQKSLADLESKVKGYTGDVRKSVEEVIKGLKDQLKQLEDPNNPMFSPDMDKLMREGHEAQVLEYNNKLKEWELQYPVSPQSMIKDRLNYFIQLSATVDFNAKLVKGPDDKMIFQNEAYEDQNYDWKYIYRSGKECSDAARAVAMQWLGELK